MRRGRTTLTARVWRRIQVLLLLDGGKTVRGTAAVVGGYPREISRVGKRYLLPSSAKVWFQKATASRTAGMRGSPGDDTMVNAGTRFHPMVSVNRRTAVP